MAEKQALIKQETVQNHIFTVRGLHVMLDSHLAKLYGTEPKRLNEQVKRNIERFPKEFMFRLEEDEYESLRSHFATLEKDPYSLRSQNATLENKKGKHRKYLPYVFTEQGVAINDREIINDFELIVTPISYYASHRDVHTHSTPSELVDHVHLCPTGVAGGYSYSSPIGLAHLFAHFYAARSINIVKQ